MKLLKVNMVVRQIKNGKLYNGTLKVDLYQYFGQRVKRQDVKVERNAMSKKRRNRHHKGEQESKFEFEEAKDLTVGQAIRKNEEVEASVTPDDTILDKYIKQHRERNRSRQVRKSTNEKRTKLHKV